ncbi:CoA-transferase [Pseudonocardia sp. WMMC193]|uniref:CoA-transferase n=1 Tax=Pseudonocardia sp. WMMC193 TaxID=2911965 RepID=UPI001F41B5B0|nr:CoA-transferase [Pseudonocardia sp. WMMC193]MCF7551979.1 CoA transferase subunit A [Pseudonocardia sp. WMMC193]
MALAEAVDALVPDGSTVAWEGVPVAVARALLRRRGLTLVSTAPGVSGDLLVGAGCVDRLVTSAVAGPRIQAALRSGLALEEHTATGMAAAYDAGAAGLPCGLLRGYTGTDLAAVTRVATVRCPFTGEQLAAVPALTPDVAIVHAPRADRISPDRLPPLYAARRALVVVDEDGGEAPWFAEVVRAEPDEDGWAELLADRTRFTAWLAQARA